MSDHSLPDPLAATAVVVADPATRTLTVKPAETRGYAALPWRQAHRAMLQAEQLGSRSYRALVSGAPPTVWAHGAGRREIAPAHPAEDGSLRFQFPRGDPAYRELVSIPGLAATVVLDRATSRILNVSFHDGSRRW
jgi:hypothetical protein